MWLYLCVLLSLILGCTASANVETTGEGEIGPTNGDHLLTIRMPNVVPRKPDALICTGRKLDPEESYIIQFSPHVVKTTAHHLMVYGCHVPDNFSPSWDCDDRDMSKHNKGVCGDGDREAVFAWALNAPQKSLPEGVGLRVGGSTRINYIVVQIHYNKAFPPGMTDNSGITLKITRKRPLQQAGYIIMLNDGYIPPHRTDYHAESSCRLPLPFTIYPIGFRTHSHQLGVVTSGYRVRDGKWTEIGRMSPQLPQTFYNVTHPGMDIRPGDQLASRCTMNSMARDNLTYMGPTHHDEMCNFYIMYATDSQRNLVNTYCLKFTQAYRWEDDFPLSDIPKDASSLDGIEGEEEVKRMFIWS